MKQDRRVQKTRQALRKALSDLIAEKPYDDITVQNLTERANVARSSFYVHFRDKDDLLLSGFQAIGVDVDDVSWPAPGSNDQDFVTVLFRGAEEWKEMSQAFLNADANVATQHMRNLLVVKMRDWLKRADEGLSESELEATVHFLASALQGLLTWWTRNDFPCPAEVMSERFYRLALSGLRDLLGPHAEKLPVGHAVERAGTA